MCALAITLARGGSKGIPRKNLAVVNKKSLLQRAIEAGQCGMVSRHYVSSDSDEILREAERLGAVPVLRPAELSTDTSSSADAIAHVLLHAPQEKYDIVGEIGYEGGIVEIMCTSPFIKPQHVRDVLTKLYTTNADSVVGVCRVYDHHPARLKYIENDVLVNFFPEKKESRRQDLEPHAYVRNGSLYAFTRVSFAKYHSRYGGICRPYVMEDIHSVNIDEPVDLLVAQHLGELHAL